jgi:Tat protein secretion system quality control protein TatD with DNase activity
MTWIDSHCHLDAAEFAPDRDAVRQAARAVGVHTCVIPAVHAAHFDEVRRLAHQHGDVYALGIHPLFTPQATDADLQTLAEALQQHRADPRLVAVGEIGLDGFVPGLDMALQQHHYQAQLKLAQRFDLPVILHVRRSADLLLKGLRQTPVKGGIAHAFNTFSHSVSCNTTRNNPQIISCSIFSKCNSRCKAICTIKACHTTTCPGDTICSCCNCISKAIIVLSSRNK